MSDPASADAIRVKTRGRWRIAAASTVAVVAVIYVGAWLHERFTHVYTDDARIVAGMVTLSATVAGPVVALDFVPGDAVRKGEILARVDDREARARLDGVDAQLAAAQAEIDEIDARIELVTERGKSRMTGAEARLAALQAAVATSSARLWQAEREHRRLEPMAQDGLVSGQALDDATYALQAAQGEQRRAGAEVRSAAAAVEEARLDLLEPELLQHRRRTLSARLRELEAERRRQALIIENHQIRSPIDGVIDKVFVEESEYVGPGQRLVMLHKPSDVWVEARIKETALEPLQLGQPVRIHVDAFPERTYRGRLERVVNAATSQFALLPSPNPSGNFTKITQRIPVRIAFDAPDPRLSPGMMVEVYIDVRD